MGGDCSNGYCPCEAGAAGGADALLKKRIKELENALNTLNATNKDLGVEVARLSEENGNLGQEVDALKSELRTKEQKVGELDDKVQEVTTLLIDFLEREKKNLQADIAYYDEELKMCLE